MKKLLLIAGAALLGLSFGYGGVYLLMPSLQPDAIDRMRMSDSLAAVADMEPVTGDRGSAATDTPAEPPPSVDAMVLRDSLDRVNAALQDANRLISQLERNREILTAQIDSVVRTQVSADEIARTVAKLEDEELRNLLRDLPDPVIKSLYAVSTLRTRTRLLKAMPPQRAAELLQDILAPTQTPVRQ